MFLFDLDKANKAFIKKVIADIAGVYDSPDDVTIFKDDLDYYCRLVEEGSFKNPQVLTHDLGKLLFWLLATIQVMDKDQRAEVMAEFFETLKERGEDADAMNEIINDRYAEIMKGIQNAM